MWMTWRIAARWKREALAKNNDQPAGRPWFSCFLVFTLLSFLTMGAVLIPLEIGARASLFVTGTLQQATVTRFTSGTERVSRDDSYGHSYTTDVVMHTPVYRFTLSDGTRQDVSGDISSENEPTVGDLQKIYYDAQRNSMVTASPANAVMLGACALFSFLLILILLATVLYAFDRSTKGVMRLLGQTLLYVVIPLAMVGMALGLGFYAYERFTTDLHDDDPLFVAGFCIFFAVTLMLVLVGGVRARLSPKT